jgi:hypothetical protein
MHAKLRQYLVGVSASRDYVPSFLSLAHTAAVQFSQLTLLLRQGDHHAKLCLILRLW